MITCKTKKQAIREAIFNSYYKEDTFYIFYSKIVGNYWIGNDSKKIQQCLNDNRVKLIGIYDKGREAKNKKEIIDIIETM